VINSLAQDRENWRALVNTCLPHFRILNQMADFKKKLGMNVMSYEATPSNKPSGSIKDGKFLIN
jgi:hypothetical protein